MSEDTAVVPSSTLYINNLEDSLNKNVLKKNLYLLFSQYGKVVDVVACKGNLYFYLSAINILNYLIYSNRT